MRFVRIRGDIIKDTHLLDDFVEFEGGYPCFILFVLVQSKTSTLPATFLFSIPVINKWIHYSIIHIFEAKSQVDLDETGR